MEGSPKPEPNLVLPGVLLLQSLALAGEEWLNIRTELVWGWFVL